MSQEALFAELEARFVALQNAIARLDAEAETNIVRWRYSVDSAFELRADFFRRFNEKPGTLIDDEPVSASIYHAYAYDAQDRIIYAATFQSEEEPRLCAFYAYDGHTIELAEYVIELYKGKYHLRTFGRLRRDATGRPLDYVECNQQAAGQAAFIFERYHYDEQDRLNQIDTQYRSNPVPVNEHIQDSWQQAVEEQRRLARMLGTEDQFEAGVLPQLETVKQQMSQVREYRTIAHYEYEGDVLRRILEQSRSTMLDGSPMERQYVIYETPREYETEERLYAAARARLRVEILYQIMRIDADIRQQSRFYSLEVYFDAVAGDGVLLTLSPEIIRQDWERTTTEATYQSLIWETHADKRVTHVNVTPPQDFARLVRLWRQDDRWGAIRGLLYRVARDLNDENWAGLLNCTQDFIVFGNDYLTEDKQEEIRASVPEDKLRMLQAKGLIE
jgi:hypothetical protein